MLTWQTLQGSWAIWRSFSNTDIVQAYTARRLQQAQPVQAIPNAVDIDLEFDAHTTANVQNIADDLGAGIANGVLLVHTHDSRPCTMPVHLRATAW